MSRLVIAANAASRDQKLEIAYLRDALISLEQAEKAARYEENREYPAHHYEIDKAKSHVEAILFSLGVEA